MRAIGLSLPGEVDILPPPNLRPGMRISFDVDDTLIVHTTDSPLEPERAPRYLRRSYPERLRLGACELFRRLQLEGWEVCVYTTSDRGQTYLRRLLRFYGARVDLVVNADRHRREVVPRFVGQVAPSKHPGLYGIDLHIDDSQGVGIEGDANHFRTLIVDPHDLEWTDKILSAASDIQANFAAPRQRPRPWFRLRPAVFLASLPHSL